MKTRLFQCATLILAMAFNAIPRWVQSNEWYYKGQAISILLWVVCARVKREDTIVAYLWDWTILLAVNNTVDEFWGDPETVGNLEITISILITLWTLYKIIKCIKTTRY